jgi:hypothetical protein
MGDGYSAVSLAHRIMGDVNRETDGPIILICTECYTYEEVTRFIKLWLKVFLNTKLGLKAFLDTKLRLKAVKKREAMVIACDLAKLTTTSFCYALSLSHTCIHAYMHPRIHASTNAL